MRNDSNTCNLQLLEGSRLERRTRNQRFASFGKALRAKAEMLKLEITYSSEVIFL